MLTARGLYKSFGDKHILKDVDITIKTGSITCAIGPSGTGKTTLLRALALLDLPERGEIDVDGERYIFGEEEKTLTPTLSQREREKNMGLSQKEREFKEPWPKVTAVFQSLFLWPHLTLRENIMLPARARNPKAQEDIEGLIALFEMQQFIDNYPNEASIGQRQRVALARALILNPRYILLDEITSALDVEQTAKILTKLAQLKERGIGVFLITHHIGFAQSAADQVVFMNDGKIEEIGGPEILSNPKSDRLRQFLSLAEIAR